MGSSFFFAGNKGDSFRQQVGLSFSCDHTQFIVNSAAELASLQQDLRNSRELRFFVDKRNRAVGSGSNNPRSIC